jgi:hypothetical protein
VINVPKRSGLLEQVYEKEVENLQKTLEGAEKESEAKGKLGGYHMYTLKKRDMVRKDLNEATEALNTTLGKIHGKKINLDEAEKQVERAES